MSVTCRAQIQEEMAEPESTSKRKTQKGGTTTGWQERERERGSQPAAVGDPTSEAAAAI